MKNMDNENKAGQISRRQFLQGSAAIVGGVALGRILPVIAAPPLRPMQKPSVISVMDPVFGAKGDGATNDRDAFQAAIDAAVKAEVPLYVPRPPQFYRIGLDPNHDRLLVPGDLAIMGDGRLTTTLRFTVSTTTGGKNYFAFFVPGGVDFHIANLRLEEDLHQPVEQFEFMGIFLQPSKADNICVVESVDIDGFTHCLYSPSSGDDSSDGELFLTVRDCDLHPWWTFCIGLWTVAGGHKRLHIYDSYLHDNQNGHLVYTHPHNSVYVENTRFDGASSWAFHFQGTEVAGNPEYQRFVGCWFGPRNSRALITQDREAVAIQVEVYNCIFEAAPAIQIRSDIIIDGCYFTSAKGLSSTSGYVAAYSNSPWRATLRNCIFAPKSNALPQVDLRLESIGVDIENCQFYNQGTGTILSLGTGGSNRYTVKDCLFYNRADNASYSISVEIDNGQALIERCRFIGRTTGDRGVFLCGSKDGGPSAESFLQVDNCTFQDISGGTLFHVMQPTNPGWSGRIVGSNNRINNFLSGKPLLVAESPVPIIGHLIPISGWAPTPVPAGPTLVVSSNYDSFDILGTADVANIHWWTADGLSNTIFTGAITLVATVSFSLVTGGNILLAGGASRRDVPAAGSVRLVYDPAQGYWSEG